MRRITLLGFCSVFWLSPGVARADFHIMKIREVLAHAGGDTRIQAIELEMEAAGQNRVGGHRFDFFDARGTKIGEFRIPGNVASARNGDRILFATNAFAAATGLAPDFVIPEGLISPFGGRVCFETVDCVAFGDYTGANAGYGEPAVGFPVTGVLALTRGRDGFPKNNATDYALAPPSFANNAGASGTPIADLECYFTDDADDLSNWDDIAPGQGIDLTNCGVPAQLDIGSVERVDGATRLIPGERDDLGLGNPIAITGLKNSVASAILDQSSDADYRLRFDIRAERGVVQAATFVRERYLFDDDSRSIDTSAGGGIGMNFTFGCHQPDAPDPCPDGSSDHFHPDVRGPCLQELAFTIGPRDGVFTAIETLEPDTDYTIIMDVDGDDVGGPVTLRVKVFPAETPEPSQYTVSWQGEAGFDFPDGEELQHVALFAALRSAGVAPGPGLIIDNLAVCAIPRNQQFVRFLECQREANGDVSVFWDSPNVPDGDDTTIFVNGVKAGEVGAATTEFTIEDAPATDIVIAVANASGVPVECSVCKNDAPTASIDGPAAVAFEGDPVAIALDASGSTDPEDSSALLYSWELTSAPTGSDATFSDPFVAGPTLTVDREGEYEVTVTVADNGCEGDLTPLEATATHTISVGEVVARPGFRRGDCNRSNSVDLSDAIFFLGFLFTGGATPECREACNTNGDANGDLSDAISLLNYLFLGGTRPPAPGPDACAPPPEDPILGCATPSC
jgi:hypothetical protein